jgi:RNA-dependent RNA polymerase
MNSVVAPNEVQVSLNLAQKKIAIEFPLSIDERRCRYRFELPIQLLQQVLKIHDDSTNQCALIIPFRFPPRFFKLAEGKELAATFTPSDRTWYEGHAWFRQTEVVDGDTMRQMASMPVMNMKNAPVIDIGMCI